MDLLLYDKTFKLVSIIDTYESLIWTDRYIGCGDFELYLKSSDEFLNKIKEGYYLKNSYSEHTMIIERIRMISDSENGDKIIVSGRSLEYILNRRIIIGNVNVSGTTESSIEYLLNRCIIKPDDPSRKIDNFIFKKTSDERIQNMNSDAQYLYSDLYSAIYSLCEEHALGFKLVLDSTNNLIFSLYFGYDRTGEVIFSPKYDNFMNSDYSRSIEYDRTFLLIGGNEQKPPPKKDENGKEPEEPLTPMAQPVYNKFVTIDDKKTGIDRSEIFIDARDITNQYENGQYMSTPEYIKKLEQRAKIEKRNNKVIEEFDGIAEFGVMFEYGKDFFLGDIVMIYDNYGHICPAEVLEVTISDDSEGFKIYPTFNSLFNVF